MSDRKLGEKIGNSGLHPASILMYLHDCDRRPPNCEFYYTCTSMYSIAQVWCSVSCRELCASFPRLAIYFSHGE